MDKAENSISFVLSMAKLFYEGDFGQGCGHTKGGPWFERMFWVCRVDKKAGDIIVNWASERGVYCPCDFSFMALVEIARDNNCFPDIRYDNFDKMWRLSQ